MLVVVGSCRRSGAGSSKATPFYTISPPPNSRRRESSGAVLLGRRTQPSRPSTPPPDQAARGGWSPVAASPPHYPATDANGTPLPAGCRHPPAVFLPLQRPPCDPRRLRWRQRFPRAIRTPFPTAAPPLPPPAASPLPPAAAPPLPPPAAPHLTPLLPPVCPPLAPTATGVAGRRFSAAAFGPSCRSPFPTALEGRVPRCPLDAQMVSDGEWPPH